MNFSHSEKTLEIDYPISNVKESIKLIVAVGKGKYVLQNSNDNFGTYNFSVTGGVQFSTIDITVIALGAEKTKLEFSAKPLALGKVGSATLEKRTNDFIKLLSLSLSGKTIDNAAIKEATSSGCAILFLIIAAAMAASFFLISSKA